MQINPESLITNLDRLEEIERTTLRMVTQAVYDFCHEASEIFANESDLVADIGEDITREALDRMGFPRIRVRLFGKIDYKQACYLFHPDYSVKQALFVDSKAEKEGSSATIQTAQTSMRIRHMRGGKAVDEQGTLPTVYVNRDGEAYLTTTIFVKYVYEDKGGSNELKSIVLAALPNGMLQDRYNPSHTDSIWRAGRNSPLRGEAFRARIAFPKLKEKQNWRVQVIDVTGRAPFQWDE